MQYDSNTDYIMSHKDNVYNNVNDMMWYNNNKIND